MNNNYLAPIVLFVYNRPYHTRKTIEALQKNNLASESNLYIFADGSKQNATKEQIQKVQETRDFIRTVSGFKEVIIEESQKNKGLANSVIYGVTKVINEFGKVIVVEDDIITHPFFLRFMNECLDVYEKREDIFMIGGFNQNFEIPSSYKQHIYLTHRSCSWGWATWKCKWDKADWEVKEYKVLCHNKNMQKRFNRGGNDNFSMLKMQMEGQIDSWCIRWDYSMFLHDALCVIPVNTLVNNSGFDNSGVHCSFMPNDFTASMPDKKEYYFELDPDIRLLKEVENNLKSFLERKNETDTLMWKIRYYLNQVGVYFLCRRLKHLFFK